MSFDALGLSAELLRAISDQGYSEPTPVQRQAIPVILEGRDLMAGAQTGTGKTAGFTLPLLQRLNDTTSGKGRRPVRALILTPTRELAAQVGESVDIYGRHLPLTSAIIFGGVKINPQIQKLRRGVDILVATPGRLLDHVSQKTLDLSSIEILVLDEADRMLDMGFIRDIRKIVSACCRSSARICCSPPPIPTTSGNSPTSCWTTPRKSKLHAATPLPSWSRRLFTRWTGSAASRRCRFQNWPAGARA